MLEQLRIQCPSCGIILDVRNSKHEAVKRITCPHCQKQLAVDFRDEVPQAPAKPLGTLYYGEMRIDLQEGVNQIPLPACDALEIKAVRLNDGNSKCLVRVLNDQQPVLLNGEPLGKDDEVALSIGDELRIGNTILTFGQQGKAPSPEPKPEPKLVEKPKEQEAPKASKPQAHIPYWAIAGITMMAALLVAWLLWPSKEKPEVSPAVKTIIADSIKKDTTQKKAEAPKSVSQDRGKEKTEKVDTPQEPTSEFELEQQALKGNVSAQIELGSRLIRRSGSSNVIRGIKYLRLAANNGSSEAQSTLTKVINTLQRQADRGDSIAYQILMSIDQ